MRSRTVRARCASMRSSHCCCPGVRAHISHACLEQCWTKPCVMQRGTHLSDGIAHFFLRQAGMRSEWLPRATIYIYIYIYICVCMYACMCIYMYIYIYIYAYIYIYICMYVCLCYPSMGCRIQGWMFQKTCRSVAYWFFGFRLTKPVSHPPSRGGVPPLCRWASLDCKKVFTDFET